MFFASKSRLAIFLNDESGSALPFLAICCLAMVLAMGAAIDMSMAQLVQARIQTATDAAALGASSTLSLMPAGKDPSGNAWTQQSWAQYQSKKYFAANFPDGYLGTDSFSSGTPGSTALLTTTYDSTAQTLSAVSTTRQKTTFMHATGLLPQGTADEYVPIGGNAKAVHEPSSGIELALVVDNSQSMSGAKLISLQSAVTGTGGLLDKLAGSSGAALPANVFVSIVPFASIVQVTDPNGIIIGSSGCPDSGDYTALFRYPSSPPAGFPTNLTQDNSEDSPVTGNGFATISCVPTSLGDGTSLSPPATILPLTNDRSVIANEIGGLSASGNTLLNVGLGWGWRTLSPNWSGNSYWWTSAPQYQGQNLPLPYGTTGMKKVLVLMTDGMNAPGYGGSNDAINAYGDYDLAGADAFSANFCNNDGTYNYIGSKYTPGFAPLGSTAKSPYTAYYYDYTINRLRNNRYEYQYSVYGAQELQNYNSFTTTPIPPDYCYLSPSKYGTTPLNDYIYTPLKSDTSTLAICQALKSEGVTIFTIGYGTPEPDTHYPISYTDRTTPNSPYFDGHLLQSCATSSSTYFVASDSTGLVSALNQIVQQSLGYYLEK